MTRPQKAIVNVKGTNITVVVGHREQDYISITDIAKHREPNRSDHVIQNWMRNRNTIEFLGIWESLNNEDFKPLEFEGFRNRAGLNSFVLTPAQWIKATLARIWGGVSDSANGAPPSQPGMNWAFGPSDACDNSKIGTYAKLVPVQAAPSASSTVR